MTLLGERILLIIGGGIAAYKSLSDSPAARARRLGPCRHDRPQQRSTSSPRCLSAR